MKYPLKYLIIKKFLSFIIPLGQYCYTVTNRDVGNFIYTGKFCRYYKIDGIRRYCSLLKKEDSIRLDQSIKICGINCYDTRKIKK